MAAKQASVRLEVHEHCFIHGARARHVGSKLVHSHAGGDVPHKHPDTGPGSYTIDKDEWARVTGLKGGGRKRFTPRPSGEQFPNVELEDWQKSFEIIVCSPPPRFDGFEGPDIAPAVRMILAFGMTVSAVRPGTKETV
jgi:hypothetical protein